MVLTHRIRRAKLCHAVLFLLILLAPGLCAGTPGWAQPRGLLAPAPKRVLLLYTYSDTLPAYQKATPAFLSAMRAGGININDLFFEYLDLQRNDNPEYRRRLANLLRYKYPGGKVDLIVTVHTWALNFLLEEGKALCPGAPVFSYLMVRPELIEAKKTERRILLRPQFLDMGGTLEIALKMFPKTRKIVLVTGAAPGDRNLEHELKDAFEPWREKLEIESTSDRSVEDMVRGVSNLPSRSIVIYNNVFSDKTGRTFIPLEVGKRVAQAANAPVFCLWDTLLGGGPIGGSLLSFEAEGAYAANAALGILNGKTLLTQRVTTLPVSKTFMFDWQQLKRWGVSESILPKESVLINRVPTLWEQYQEFFIAGIAVFVGQTLLVIGLLVQMRRRRTAERSLRQKTEELDLFFNVNLDILCIANTDGYFLRLNPAIERILGYAREELMAKRFIDFVHPGDVERTLNAISALASQEKVLTFANRYRCKDGTYRWLEWSSVPAGERIYAAARDMTERKRTEEELRKSEERLRLVLEANSEGVWDWNIRTGDAYFSPRYSAMLGYTPEEFAKSYSSWKDLVHPDDFERVNKAHMDHIHGHQDFCVELRMRKKSGEWCWILSRGMVVARDEEGGATRMVGTHVDITERKRAEEELRNYQEQLEERVKERTAELRIAKDQAQSADRAKSAFLANMSHELRTPLNSILGIAQLMARDAGFPGQHQDGLTILNRSGGYLLELINDVLEMSRIEAGKVILNPTSFDLHSFLGDLEELMKVRADQKGLSLLFEYKPGLPRYIETDVHKLRQILVNLLGNAMKYTEKGYVTLKITVKEGIPKAPETDPPSGVFLQFEIEDTGIGIAPEDMGRIFEPFVQLNPGQRSREGTGLGLTLSRMFVELLGGEISVRSEVGRGSTFAFSIAIKPAESTAIHTEEAVQQVIGLMPGQLSYRILVVDDSVENRFTLRRLLEQVGFTVIEAAGGEEAVDLYRERHPHLIWMDLRMPGMDGNEAAVRIREAERGRRNGEGKEMHTPIIALTAGVMENKKFSSHFELFDDWVYKPYRETEIFEMLEKHLGAQFIYRPSAASAAEADTGPERDAATVADLSRLAAGWLEAFSQGLRRGRSAQLLSMIDQIPPSHAALARTLTEWVRVHRFDKLMAATEVALKEISNG
jgi:PAS domain S-box-containing protein